MTCRNSVQNSFCEFCQKNLGFVILGVFGPLNLGDNVRRRVWGNPQMFHIFLFTSGQFVGRGPLWTVGSSQESPGLRPAEGACSGSNYEYILRLAPSLFSYYDLFSSRMSICPTRTRSMQSLPKTGVGSKPTWPSPLPWTSWDLDTSSGS